jgi:dihydroxy-acid dehydratase
MTMGTASTMACISEALGMSLGQTASIPSVDSRRTSLAEDAGRRAVELARQGGPRPSEILTEDAFENAIRALMAIGGSTNAVIHLTALAGRVGVQLPQRKFEELSRTTPLLVNVEPSGTSLMEDFHYAGGLPAVLKELLPLIHQDAITVSGKTIAESVSNAEIYDHEVIRPLTQPLAERGGMTFLTGNLCPGGAVLKVSAASPELLQHRGPAVVFENVTEMWTRCLDEAAEFDSNCVIVLRGGGPKGAPGMPEWGMPLIPVSLLKKGVTDIVRITDARMSGTSYGTTVLHVTPESAVGGPLALVQDGDIIELDTAAHQLNVLVDPDELERRRQQLPARPKQFERGYGAMFMEHILQADEGCDFDFLKGSSPAGTFAATHGA